jgi:hypothetical protein
MRHREQWVVTYRIETSEGIILMEFFRGSRAECSHIARHSGRGENDQERTGSWKPIIGCASEWDEMLSNGCEALGLYPAVAEAR